MRFLKNTTIDFISKIKVTFWISGVLIAVSLLSMLYHPARKGIGPNWSIDFVGGTLLQLQFEKPVLGDIGTIRGIANGLGFGSAEVKRIGQVEDNELQVMIKKQDDTESASIGDMLQAALQKGYPDNQFSVRRVEHVGPKIGSELRRVALMALLISLAFLIIYIGFRFNLPFGVAAVVALFHDVIITVGIFSIGNFEISLPIIAALLTIIGYSVNDTIVVFDRIRENAANKNIRGTFEEKVNLSLNQTLSRTVITSGTTLVAVLALLGTFFRSGDVIEFFALAMMIGILIGTYSSIYVATSLAVVWNRKWPFTIKAVHYNK